MRESSLWAAGGAVIVTLARSPHGHALFLEAVGVGQRALVWKQSVFQTAEEYQWKLQALR